MSDINRLIEPTNWIKFTADLLEDKRIKRIMKKFGASQGLGILVFLLIKLRKENEYKYPLADIDLLADEIGVNELDINNMKESGLFEMTECNNYFFCPSLNYWMESYDKKKIQTSQAGKISAQKKKLKKEKLLNEKNSKSTNVVTNVEDLSSVRNTEEEVEVEVEVTTTTNIIYIKAKDAMPIYKSIISDGKDFTYQYNRFKALNLENKRTVENWKRWCMQIKKFEKQIAS